MISWKKINGLVLKSQIRNPDLTFNKVFSLYKAKEVLKEHVVNPLNILTCLPDTSKTFFIILFGAPGTGIILIFLNRNKPLYLLVNIGVKIGLKIT